MSVFVTHIVRGKGAPVTQAAGGIGPDFIIHVVTKFLPCVTQENTILIGIGTGIFVRFPIGKRGNHADRVEALLFTKGNGIFKADARSGTIVGVSSGLPKW